MNTNKTKEMVIDLAPVNIQGGDIEVISVYKYLGVHLNNKLDWSITQMPCTRRAKVVSIS